MANDIKEKEAPKKGFKMPDIYIILGCFILVMAVLTYIVPAGQYDRQVVETAHGVQNLVVSGTYKTVEQHPAGFFDIITAIPLGFDRAVGIVVLTFMVGACMGLIKRAGLIDLGVQRLSRAVGTSEFLVAPILMFVLSLLAAFIGVPELSLAYLPVFLPLFYRLGYDGMSATAVALLGPCIGFTFGITIPGSVGMGQQIAQLPMFSGADMRAAVLVVAVTISILYVMRYASKVKKDPTTSLTYETDKAFRAELMQAEEKKLVFTRRQVYAGISCLVMFPYASANAMLREANERVVIQYLNRVRRSSFAARVEEELHTMLASGEPAKIADVARRVNLSARTLQRRLESEGVTFAELFERRRRQLAHDALAHTELSITEIAYNIGFSDPSNFSRTCTRWFGVSPAVYRRRIRQLQT